MKTIVNVSSVTDYSGEQPIITQSNPVTTVIKEPAPAPVITRFFYRLCCPCCCNCCCNCRCGCGDFWDDCDCWDDCDF